MNCTKESNSKKYELNKIDIFDDLKNDYFLRIIFDNLQKKKMLNIIKYNKKIQKRININNNDFKEYSEIYSSIELEIIPINNKSGIFINIKKEDEKYYHIYFNNKEEIKRNYIKQNENINKITIIINNQIKSFSGLFCYCECIESMYFKKFYRNNINNMNDMFYGCSSLKEINLSNFNTNNVINMNYHNPGCYP